MLYHLFYPLSRDIGPFNIFRYITFRSIVAFFFAAVFAVWFGKYFIAYMKKKQFGQVVRDDGPQSHLKKSGTPTMGGLFIIVSVLVALFLCGNFTSIPLLLTLGVTLSYALLGFVDDYSKVMKKNTKGVSAKGKLLWQFVTAAAVGFIMIHYKIVDSNLYIPFMKGPIVNLGYGYIAFIALVIVGSSNAVNLTDGLDGLAIGPIITSAASLGLLAYVAGHKEIAEYLLIPYGKGNGELLVVCSALIGAGVGFLWYNSYPAQIFMGDVGSLAMGGLLGIAAVLTKNEILFVFIGGIFVTEAISVILQVGSFKLRKKRIFKMAPIHHHFELKGWAEPKVIVRFWIISLCLAVLSISTLKIR